MAAGAKIKELEAQTMSGKQAYQRLPGPVMLIALPPPAKDYLCLSVTSFCFCILLAIPALLFSLKVGTIQLLAFSPGDLLMPYHTTGVPPSLFAIWPCALSVSLSSWVLLNSLIRCPSQLFLPLGTKPCPFFLTLPVLI